MYVLLSFIASDYTFDDIFKLFFLHLPLLFTYVFYSLIHHSQTYRYLLIWLVFPVIYHLIHLQFLEGFMLFTCKYSVSCFVDRCLSFWPWCCLSFCDIQILITPLVSFGHCVVCLSAIYGFWLPIWYLLTIVLSVFLWFTDSDYPFGIFWSLCCLSFYDLRILITPLVSFDYCFVCLSTIYRFWLPFWYLQTLLIRST
jgi:hypothetical protein